MFNVSKRTAERWIAEDRRRFVTKNLCFSHIKGYYALDDTDIA